MIALVFLVKTALIVADEMLPLFISTSAKTGVAPALITQDTDAIKVRGVTTTSSPGSTPRPCKARSSAKVPLDKAIAK